MNLHVVILAAGQGKRMNSAAPKVLHKLAGKSLLEHVITTAKSLNPNKIHIVYGNGGDKVREAIPIPGINWVEQKKRLGTAHAVMQVVPFIPNNARVLVLYGDVPLLPAEVLDDLVNWSMPKKLGVLVAEFENPFGFGRIIRSSKGLLKAIVEEKDASDEQRKICEINTGIMTFSSAMLKKYLPLIKAKNAQKEYYLTDVISLATADGEEIIDVKVPKEEEAMGINDKVQLAQLERFYQREKALQMMKLGLTLADPNRFDLRGELVFGKDVFVDINTIFEGKIQIGDDSSVGANCVLRDVKIGKNVVIKPYSIIEASEIQDNCIVGPFARIRPDSIIEDGAHIGNFVEIKKSHIGKGSKVNHLTYMGDSIVGKNVNVGAGTITCNYDGAKKHQTIIEDGAFIGSSSQLVAPVRIGKKAYIGTGSTIVSDAPAGKLTLARSRQVTIKKWQPPKK